MNMKDVINLINSHPERAKNALDHVYRGKVFVVVTSYGRVDGYFKTRRGAEGYIKKQSRVSWYDDYTQSMVTAGTGLEVVEVAADQIKDYKTYRKMWWNWFFDWLDRPHWADNIVQSAKRFGVSEDLFAWIEKTAREVKETGGLTHLEDELQEELTEEQQSTIEQNNLQEQPTDSSITVTLNEQLQGIEIRFSEKPAQEVIEQLKINGFRWSKRGFWYAKQSDKTLVFTQSLTGQTLNNNDTITEYAQEQGHTNDTNKEDGTNMKTLIFEGTGWEKAESGIVSGVGNCRIRTRLRNNDGRVIYLEMSGFIHSEKKKPKFAQDFKVVGHIDNCFYADSRWDANRNRSDELSHLESIHFEYSKENILKLVNQYLNCSFDDMIVINDGSIRVFDNTEPLCSCCGEDYVPYKDIKININVLENVTPMALWPHHRYAKYNISYEFVRNHKRLGEWISTRNLNEQEKFPHYNYYAALRWDENGVITSAEISALQGDFCLMSIGSESLICLINEILTMNSKERYITA